MTKPAWPPADFWDRPDKKFTLDDLKPLGRNNAIVYSTLKLIEAGHDREQALICAMGYICSQFEQLHDLAVRSRLNALAAATAPDFNPEVPKKVDP